MTILMLPAAKKKRNVYSKNVVCCGYTGSSAQKNAKEYGIPFVSLEQEKTGGYPLDLIV